MESKSMNMILKQLFVLKLLVLLSCRHTYYVGVHVQEEGSSLGAEDKHHNALFEKFKLYRLCVDAQLRQIM